MHFLGIGFLDSIISDHFQMLAETITERSDYERSIFGSILYFSVQNAGVL